MPRPRAGDAFHTVPTAAHGTVVRWQRLAALTPGLIVNSDGVAGFRMMYASSAVDRRLRCGRAGVRRQMRVRLWSAVGRQLRQRVDPPSAGARPRQSGSTSLSCLAELLKQTSPSRLRTTSRSPFTKRSIWFHGAVNRRGPRRATSAALYRVELAQAPSRCWPSPCVPSLAVRGARRAGHRLGPVRVALATTDGRL
ncbi:MAG: hypothetical protein RL385_4170 [Pseudomonadota bacterium]|jgi:hypothetical protein